MNNDDGHSPVSWGLIKFIFSYIPKWIKSWIGGIITFVLGLGGSLIQPFIEGKEIVMPNLITFGIYFLFAIGFTFLIGVILANYKIAKEYHKKLNEPTQNIPIAQSQPVIQTIRKQKKNLPYKFELLQLKVNEAEFTIFIRRGWLPNEAKAGKEDFVKALEISSNPICAKCKGDLLFKYYRSGHKYTCLKCQILIDPDLLNTTKEAIFVDFKGDVRSNYTGYWKKYCDLYDEYTNGKYEDYEEPRY